MGADSAEDLAEDRRNDEDKKRPEKTPENASCEKVDLFGGESESLVYGDDNQDQSDKLDGGDKEGRAEQ